MGQVYEGIDAAFYGNADGQLEYDLIVHPGAEPTSIVLEFDGAQRLRLDGSGNLVLDTVAGTLTQRAPVAYQEVQGTRHTVEARYEAPSGKRVAFAIGPYDPSLPLVIDPVLIHSTFLGGSGNTGEHGIAIATDVDGNSYVTGSTTSADFPTAPGAFQTQANLDGSGGFSDAFVSKLDAKGTTLLWSTFLGGGANDFARGIAIDGSGNVVVTGATNSLQFPILNAAQPSHANTSQNDAFVAKLTPSGSALVFSTYLGGTAEDTAIDVAVDASNAVYVTGSTSSSNFPVHGALQATSGGGRDAFVTKFTTAGAFAYSTYLGRSGDDPCLGIAISTGGAALLVGNTNSPDFPTTALAFQPALAGGRDAFLLKIDPTGASLEFSTFLGGSQDDTAIKLAIDGSGSLVVAGSTASSDFPTKDALQPALAGGASDAFVAKFDATGSALVWSTYLGGPPHPEFTFLDGADFASDVAVDDVGAVYLTGVTHSPAFPTSKPLQSTHGGGRDDAFVTKIDPTGSLLRFSTYLGGSTNEIGHGIAVDRFRHAHVTGGTHSNDFPVTEHAFDPAHGGHILGSNDDVFVSKIASMETRITSGPGAFTNDSTPTFAFEASEAGATFQCSIDSAAFAACSSSLTLAPLADGAHAFEVRAVVDGETDLNPARRSFVVDTIPPNTTIVSGPSGPTNDATPIFEFSSDESPNVSFECALDGGAFTTCSSPYEVTAPLSDGDHLFAVRAVDLAGNVDLTPPERSFRVDTVPPETTLDSAPGAFTNVDPVSFSFSSNEVGSKFLCRLSPAEADFSDCGVSPKEYLGLPESAFTFEVKALDLATNEDPTPPSHAFTVDRTPPILALVSPAGGSSHATTPIDVTIEASEAVVVSASTMFASGTTSLPAGNTTVSLALVSGYNTFTTFVRDLAGNTTLLTFQLFLDQVPPELSFLSPPSGGAVYYSPASVLISLSEDSTVVAATPAGWLGVAVGGTLGGGERTLTLSLASGDNVFTATLQDAAGNQRIYDVATATAFHLFLDSVKPPSPVIASPSDGASLPSRSVTVSGTAGGNATQVRISAATTTTVAVAADDTWSGEISLASGPNRIRAVAFSAAGGESPEASVFVTAEGNRRIAVESGRTQVTGLLTLSAPFTAKVTDAGGAALGGLTVIFRIVEEPATGDALFPNGEKSTSASTDPTTGLASAQVTTGSGTTDANGFLQAVVVEATVEGQSGAPAHFSVQPLGTGNLSPSALPVAYLIPLTGINCGAFAPTGECAVDAVNTEVSDGFAVLALDANFQVVLEGTTIEFAVETGSQGSFAGGAVASATTDANGVARSGPFRLGTVIGAPAPAGEPCSTCSVMLNASDASTTRIRQQLVRARTPNASVVSGQMSAWAHAGPVVALADVSVAARGGPVQAPARDSLDVRADDEFGNPVSNATVTFTAVAGSVPDPGSRLFRATPGVSSAAECGFELAHAEDLCAVTTLSATTFDGGTAWAQMLLGKRASTDYSVTAASGSGSVPFVRPSDAASVTAPGDANAQHTFQLSYTGAAVFAITDTENDDTDPVTAVAWKITCDDVLAPIGTCDGTFTSARDPGRTISFASDNGASFTPSAPVTGTQTSVDGGGRVPVATPEVAAFLVGGPDPATLTHSLSMTVNPTFLLQVAGAARKPVAVPFLGSVTLGCALNPRMQRRVYCGRPLTIDPSFQCRPDAFGVTTYIDLDNGHTENNVLMVKVEHPSSSPVPSRTVLKFDRPARTKETGAVSYYDPVTGASGTPGLYTIDTNAPLKRTGTGEIEIPFGTGHRGCAEFIAKSYKRTADVSVTQEPANATFEFVLPDGTTFGGPIELPGDPDPAKAGKGWADEITRQRDTICDDGSVPCRIGVKGGDGVADWVQMRAWDYLTTNIHPGGVPEPDDSNQEDVFIEAGEPKEVFDTVAHVASVCCTDPFYAQTAGGKCPSGPNELCPGPTHDTWIAEPTITFNLRDPLLRTDEPAEKIYSELFLDPIYKNEYQTSRAFFNTTAHEARHAWQFTLLARSNGASSGTPQWIPSTITVLDHDSGSNTNPDNNDDLDCLPEAAFLVVGGGTNIGVPGKSAHELVDQPCTDAEAEAGVCPNDEFRTTILGDAVADDCSALDKDASRARERDGSRFARGVVP